MAENSKIEWTDHTFNPWTGCTKVSPGCDHCYAEGWAKRSGAVKWGTGEQRRRTSEANWKLPLKWNRQAQAEGRRFKVFCASLADVFDNSVPPEWRADLFALIRATPHLDWLLLTKRIGNATAMLPDDWGDGYRNVGIGATMVNQAEVDRDLDKLDATPAWWRFLSMEPLLGEVLFPVGALWGTGGRNGIDWVIVGGESGPGARPMHPEWVRSIRDQCRQAGVPFLFKQHGEWLATTFCDGEMAMLPSRKTVYVRRDGDWHDGRHGVDFFGGDEETAWVGKKAAGRLLDGVEHNGFPEGL